MFNKEWQDIYVRLNDKELVIGNGVMERAWDMDGIRPAVRSLTDKRTGKQWLSLDQQSQWEERWPEKNYAFYIPGVTEGTMKVVGVTAEADDDFGIGEEHLKVVVTLAFESFTVNWIHLVYACKPIMRTFLNGKVADEKIAERPYRPAEWPAEYTDALPLLPMHCSWKCVEFEDRTDNMQNLVQEKIGIFSRRENVMLQGNVLVVNDDAEPAGIVLVKEGPVPMGYLPGMTEDFELHGMNVFFRCGALTEEEARRVGELTSYGNAVMLWNGEEYDAMMTLDQYSRCLRKFVPERDAMVMANTWGDGSADGGISEEFLMRELACAARLGISVFQVDDGWQAGVTGNSILAKDASMDVAWGEGYYKTNPAFWSVNRERLPNGLEPLVAFAAEKGFQMGLWFSPDSQDSFVNWQKDADRLIELHKTYDVRAFKMDGLIFRDKLSEENFGKLMQKVVKATGGKVIFNLDTTASVRNGYFGRCQYGNLFLENRFVSNFGRWPNYWPHLTLRNIWMLSRYLPGEKIQAEMLNVKKHTELYGDDPLSPASCGIGYAFACTMAATPLLFMHLSSLDEESMNILEPLIRTYRGIMPEWTGGFIQPIGEIPNGFSWTGFQSRTDEKSGFLLLLREWNDRETAEIKLGGLKDVTLKLEKVLGSGEQEVVQVNSKGEAAFALKDAHGFVMYRYSVQ